MNAVYDALTHAWSEEEGVMEVDSPYAREDCEGWTATVEQLNDLQAIHIVPNLLIRKHYLQAIEGLHRDSNDGTIGWDNEVMAIVENIKEAYQRITGQDLKYRSISDKLRIGLGIGPKQGKTEIFVERELAEAVVMALSIHPKEVGI